VSNKQKSIRALSTRYSTNTDIVELLLDTLGEANTVEILKMHKAEIKRTLRLNLLHFNKNEIFSSLKEEEIRVVPDKTIPESCEVVFGELKIGHSLAYLKGMISPQGYGSMLTVHLLDPQPGEIILDMAAAPGNKTCFIGERMKNQGVLYANDSSKPRLLSLRANLNRHGIKNCIITNYDGAEFPQSEKFDKILLDAPCTGEGLLVSQPERRKSRQRVDSFILQRTQQRLVRNALQLLKPKGTLVYSTCSLNTIENEEVIESFLQDLDEVNLDPSRIKYTRSEKIPTSIRLLPNNTFCDGFYIFKGVKK
jgi:NOL1/NOP2/sun family putative RNA methylase